MSGVVHAAGSGIKVSEVVRRPSHSTASLPRVTLLPLKRKEGTAGG